VEIGQFHRRSDERVARDIAAGRRELRGVRPVPGRRAVRCHGQPAMQRDSQPAACQIRDRAVSSHERLHELQRAQRLRCRSVASKYSE